MVVVEEIDPHYEEAKRKQLGRPPTAREKKEFDKVVSKLARKLRKKETQGKAHEWLKELEKSLG